MLRNPAVRVWVAELESVPGQRAFPGQRTFPVGYAFTILYDRPENPFRFAHRFCEIDQIAVSAEFRGRGVARTLIQRVLEDARSNAIADVELTSWCFNGDAHEAFRALGFTQKIVRFGRRADDAG
jgi:ribosomal protein S18 acetylase RimI-like enzyme